MKPYLVTATDLSGKRETFAREAASIEHLRAVLEREGYAAIEFVDDELSAQLRMQRPEAARAQTPEALKLEAKLRHGPRNADIWWYVLRSNRGFVLVLAAMLGYGLWKGSLWWIVPPLILVFGAYWLIRRGLGRADRYQDLLRAYACGDWTESEALIAELAVSEAATGNEQLLVDLQFRLASIQAKRGELEAALAAVEALRSSPHAAHGMFEGRLASIYYQAGRLDDFLRCMEQSFEASGRGQLQQLDLAFAQARVGDIARADALLAGVEERNLSALHKPIYLAVQGLIAWRRDERERALPLLERAVREFSAFAENPATWPIQAMLVGHLALALAAAGRRDEARTLLAPWQPAAAVSLDAQTWRAIEHDVLG